MAYGSINMSGGSRRSRGKKYPISLSLAGEDTLSFSCDADILHDSAYIVDDSDTFASLVTFNIGDLAGNNFTKYTCAVIQCISPVPVEISLNNPVVTTATDVLSGSSHTRFILKKGQYIMFPTSNIAQYDATTSAARKTGTGGNDSTETFVAPETDGTLQATGVNEGGTWAVDDTTLTVVDGDFIKVNDYIEVQSELCLVTAKPSQHNLTVERGSLGTTPASHSDGLDVDLYFLNEQGDTRVSTNDRGYYSASNFFGRARNSAMPMGLVPGSIAIKVPFNAYQELGLSTQSFGSSSGLAVSTAYKFKISITEKGSTTIFDNVGFTTSSSNVRWGGADGVIQKIQDAMDATTNLFADVNVIAGDIRFSARNHHSDQEVALDDPGSGTTMFGVGNIPAVASANEGISAKFPTDTETNYILFDDGNGNLNRQAGGGGKISYETGAIQLWGLPARAEFQYAAYWNSWFSGKIDADRDNQIISFKGRSVNAFREGKIRVIVYNTSETTEEMFAGGRR